MTKRFAVLSLSLAVAMAAIVSASQAGAAKPAAQASKTIAALQGAWMITSANGQDMSGSGQEVLVTITDTKYVQTANGQVVERGSFKIDDTKKPIWLDLAITEGDDAGKTQLAVMQIDGKTMQVKLADPGAARPADFAPVEGSNVFTLVKK